jgi:hypothetical protein
MSLIHESSKNISEVDSLLAKKSSTDLPLNQEGLSKTCYEVPSAGVSAAVYLPLSQVIPSGAIVTSVIVDTLNALTGSVTGVTASIMLNQNILVTDQAVDGAGNPFKSGVSSTLSAPVKTTAVGEVLTLTPGSGSLTAGKLCVIVKYIVA